MFSVHRIYLAIHLTILEMHPCDWGNDEHKAIQQNSFLKDILKIAMIHKFFLAMILM